MATQSIALSFIHPIHFELREDRLVHLFTNVFSINRQIHLELVAKVKSDDEHEANYSINHCVGKDIK